MSNRLVHFQWLDSSRTVGIPLVSYPMPVKWRINVIIFHPIKTLGMPVFMFLVPVILDEGEIFAICDQILRYFKCWEKDFMTPKFIVKAESIAIVSNVVHGIFNGNKLIGSRIYGYWI